jgi:hypothetical protein
MRESSRVVARRTDEHCDVRQPIWANRSCEVREKSKFRYGLPVVDPLEDAVRRSPRPALAALASLVVAATTFLSAGAADAGSSPVMDAGPPYDFTTELMGQFVFVPLMDKAILTRTTHGYVFRTGQQDSRLVIKQVDRGLRFHDRGTKYLIELSPSCRQRPVKVGIAAVCRIPGDISRRQQLLVEVLPLLGDDYTDAHTLSA